MKSRERAERAIEALVAAGQTLGACESLTGGGVVHALTAVPGASQVIRGALVTYASDVKVSLVGVDAAVVAAQGVVNEQVARQMAQGARRVLATDWALALTGVAGPTEQDGQPVGRVWMALAGPDQVVAEQFHFRGDRERVRESAIASGLDLVIHCVADTRRGNLALEQ